MQTFVRAQVKARPEGSIGDDIRSLVHEGQKGQVQERLEARLLEALV
jgi:hypothetical protein